MRLLLALVALLLLVPSAHAGTTLVLPDGTERPQPWQTWVDRSQVPTPDVHVDFRVGERDERCSEHGWGCVWRDDQGTWTIRLAPPGAGTIPARFLLWHELGHIVDWIAPGLRRGQFRRLADILGRPWRDPSNPLASGSEWLADAWSMCARSSKWPPSASWSPFAPTVATHRKVCRLIARAY